MIFCLAAVAFNQPTLAKTVRQTQDLNQESVTQLVNEADKALGASARGTWEIKGTDTLNGLKESFDFIFDIRSRFMMIDRGEEYSADGFDGKHCWATQFRNGIPHMLSYSGRDHDLLEAYMLAGLWGSKSSGLQYRAVSQENGLVNLDITPKGGFVHELAGLDPTTKLLMSASWWSPSGGRTWQFSGYQRFGERTIPTYVETISGADKEVFQLASCVKISSKKIDYGMPLPELNATTYSSAKPMMIPVIHKFGYTFVHPLINGKDVGWFFLDSGADAMVIDPAIAKRLGMHVITHVDTTGVVAVAQDSICKGKSFQLGFVSFKNPRFIELPELAGISTVLKMPIAGICGYDFLSRATVVLDPTANSMQISIPGQHLRIKGVSWLPIKFSTNIPITHFTFRPYDLKLRSVRGLFSIDTGSNSAVDFFSPAVKEYQLESDQKLLSRTTGGAGGAAESRVGKVAWFQVAGFKIKEPTVGFQDVSKGVFASPYQVGNVGDGFLGRFKLVFDYSQNRIGFIRLPSYTAPALPQSP